MIKKSIPLKIFNALFFLIAGITLNATFNVIQPKESPSKIISTNNSVFENSVYVEDFRKKKDEVDDTKRIQRAIDYAIKHKIYVVVFSPKDYQTSFTIKLYSNVRLVGLHKFKTRIISQGDIPTFASEGYFDSTKGSENIQIENIGVYPRKVETKTNYSIEMVNTYNSTIENCYINELEMSKDDVGGIRFSKSSNYMGPNFVNSVRECQLQNASIVMESTDSYIQNNEIWADKRSFAIHLMASSQFVTNNQIVGSEIKGGIWIEDTNNNDNIELIRITDNYFDGSYDNINSGMGIYAVKMSASHIIGNDFWRLMDEGVRLNNSNNLVINSNVFSNNNRRNQSKDDILLINCSASTVNGNTFERILDQINKGSPIKTINSLDRNIFSDNTYNKASNYNKNSLSSIDIEN